MATVSSVPRGSSASATGSPALAGGLPQDPGDPPVHDIDRAVFADHDVGGLEVSMDDPASVGERDRLADLLEDGQEPGPLPLAGRRTPRAVAPASCPSTSFMLKKGRASDRDPRLKTGGIPGCWSWAVIAASLRNLLRRLRVVQVVLVEDLEDHRPAQPLVLRQHDGAHRALRHKPSEIARPHRVTLSSPGCRGARAWRDRPGGCPALPGTFRRTTGPAKGRSWFSACAVSRREPDRFHRRGEDHLVA